jgi:hypothetical protein
MADLRVDLKKRNSHMDSNNHSTVAIRSRLTRLRSMELLRREHQLKTLIKQGRQQQEAATCRMGMEDQAQLQVEESKKH